MLEFVCLKGIIQAFSEELSKQQATLKVNTCSKKPQQQRCNEKWWHGGRKKPGGNWPLLIEYVPKAPQGFVMWLHIKEF